MFPRQLGCPFLSVVVFSATVLEAPKATSCACLTFGFQISPRARFVHVRMISLLNLPGLREDRTHVRSCLRKTIAERRVRRTSSFTCNSRKPQASVSRMQYAWLFAKGLHDIRMCKWLPIRTHEIRQVRSASRQKGRFTYM
jgi:hypothetical protein